MQTFKLNLSIEKPFGNLFRAETVLIICHTANNTILLGDKVGFYPEGISRLLGGGVEKSDTSLVDAAQSELEEETCYRPSKKSLKHVAQFVISARDSQKKRYSHTAHVFYCKIPPEVTVQASDDVTHISEATVDQLKTLAQKYSTLSKEAIASDGSLQYSWYDFGQVYAPIHSFAAQYIQELKK